jgi:NAD(P)-dependent dehydrogenase (short-subunit alcohol dehydrogenase family)
MNVDRVEKQHPGALFDLAGTVAVVTGGSRGIGLGIARALAGAGADIVVASRKVDACEHAAQAISAEFGVKAVGIGSHVGRWAECDELVDRVYEAFGRCDVLVNNAGMSPLYDSLTSVSEEYFDKVAAVNLKGPFRLAALFGERMAAGDGGSIINVSSIGSLRPGVDELVYACAKAGLNALTVGLAEAYAPKVRANAILPGAIATDAASEWSESMLERVSAEVPAGRIGIADDFAGIAVWLASEASSYVTGELMRVDGGRFRQT